MQPLFISLILNIKNNMRILFTFINNYCKFVGKYKVDFRQ